MKLLAFLGSLVIGLEVVLVHLAVILACAFCILMFGGGMVEQVRSLRQSWQERKARVSSYTRAAR